MYNFQGKRALVTGGTRGIGRKIVCMLHSYGAEVVVVATNRDALEELKSELKDNCIIQQCNLLERGSVESLLGEIVRDGTGVDILVSNAGITRDGLVSRMSDEDWDDVMQVNLTSFFQLVRGISKYMMKKKYGKVINLSSVVGVAGHAGQANYSASKAASIAFCKSIALELARRNVTLNTVAPGFIETDMTDVLSDKQKESILDVIPMKKMGTVEDVANLVLFLASDLSSYITGQTFHVNGGMLMV